MRLLRAVGTVAGVTETRNDVGIVIEGLVDGRGPYRHVGMDAAQALERGRYRNQTDEADVAGAALLEPVDRGNRGVRGGDHRRDDDYLPFGKIERRLEIVFDGDERFRIAIEPDVGDARGRQRDRPARPR